MIGDLDPRVRDDVVLEQFDSEHNCKITWGS
jgi:hypothetical protein